MCDGLLRIKSPLVQWNACDDRGSTLLKMYTLLTGEAFRTISSSSSTKSSYLAVLKFGKGAIIVSCLRS